MVLCSQSHYNFEFLQIVSFSFRRHRTKLYTIRLVYQMVDSKIQPIFMSTISIHAQIHAQINAIDSD